MTQAYRSIRTACAALIFAGIATTVVANEIQPPPQGRGHQHGPPPEFFQACQDKGVGDKVTLKTPHGDTIEAVCETKDSRLIARPLNPPPQPPEQR